MCTSSWWWRQRRWTLPLLYMLVGTWTTLRLRLTERLLKWSFGCRMNSPPSSTLFPNSSTSLINTALKYSYWRTEGERQRWDSTCNEINLNTGACWNFFTLNHAPRCQYVRLAESCYHCKEWLGHLSAESERSLRTKVTWGPGSSQMCMLLQWKAAELTNLLSAPILPS